MSPSDAHSTSVALWSLLVGSESSRLTLVVNSRFVWTPDACLGGQAGFWSWPSEGYASLFSCRASSLVWTSGETIGEDETSFSVCACVIEKSEPVSFLLGRQWEEMLPVGLLVVHRYPSSNAQFVLPKVLPQLFR